MASLTSGFFAVGEMADGPTKVGCSVFHPQLPQTTSSRSTSPGSSSHALADSPLIGSATADMSPEKNSPLFVRNTFIEEIGRPLSLEGFLHDRAIQSCPVSRGVSIDDIGAPPGLENLMETVEAALSDLSQTSELPLPDTSTSPYCVRNTFIDEKIGRPMSLEGFLEERAAFSCPVSREASLEDFGMPGGLENLLASIDELNSTPMQEKMLESIDKLGSAAIPETPMLWPAAVADGCLGMHPELQMMLAGLTVAEHQHQEPASCFDGLAFVPPPPMHCAPMISPAEPPPPPTVAPGTREVQLADAVPEPELGSPALPTKGSSEHRHGTCKPCAFVYTKGCSNGVECTFCHLCPPGERKQRRKERKIQLYEARIAAERAEALPPR
eukprot:TRINITY_DN73669_c0_g1_i1.p1 TRINITY_DN73669_c0_g1~~TRINITY_DN73669_c0_g1_i1.p1  ORF type:complete len:408 (+),score=62.91 TRINITY_DN73669_c0_g1_i1:73-1224(+)